MTLDTKTKRASVLGVGRPWARTKQPDGTKPEAWRIATGFAYGGNGPLPDPNFATFVCMKNVTGTLMTAALTLSEMRAALTGTEITADLTTRCE